VGCTDPFEKVNGSGIEALQKAGVKVTTGILEEECKELNKRFFTFHTKRRPYIILKWAQSKNRRIANADFSRVWITNVYSNRLIHKWRSEEAGIMVGTNTALQDDPALNTRHWTGTDPVRLIVDMNLRLPAHLQIFNQKQPTIVINTIKHEEKENLIYYKVEKESSVVSSILNACYQLNIQSIIIEGGNKLAESFINEHAWDEARVIENTTMIIDNGLRAPALSNQVYVASRDVATDNISFYKNSFGSSLSL
jgi:diaminohydroxyphosphoribosylaminopyrimidine deaminase/5-amino-6-(5-phosphoribosylamino)uracil reductase